MNRDLVKQVKERVDVVDIIGMTVSLRRSGSRFNALCPFHDEKTPSFYVDPVRQSWRCFGCQKGGDVFEFVQERDKLTFPEALEFMARRAGISLDSGKGQRSSSNAERLRLFDILEESKSVFQENLRGRAGEQARQYLERRGFTQKAIEEFGLGWSVPDGRALVQRFAARDYKHEELVRVGVARKRDGGGQAYDSFRGRLMIPITDARGRVVGFGGRVLDNSKPKYINSSESEIFQKRSLLYGFEQARTAIHDQGRAVLMEGYTDVILAHQKGVRSAVATLGTSLTEDQCRFLKRHVDMAVLVYDGDEAGQRAAERALPILSGSGLQVRVMHLEPGKDPGDFFTENDQNAFEERLEGGSSDAIEFQFLRSKNRALSTNESSDSPPKPLALKDLSSKELGGAERVMAGKDLINLLKSISDPLALDVAVQRASELLGVGVDSLKAALGRAQNAKKRFSNPKSTEAKGSSNPLPKPKEKTAKTRAIRELVAALAADPFLVEEILPHLRESAWGKTYLNETRGEPDMMSEGAELDMEPNENSLEDSADSGLPVPARSDASLFPELLEVASMVTRLDIETEPSEELLEVLRSEPEIRAWVLEVRDTVPLVDPRSVVSGAISCLEREAKRETLQRMREDLERGLSDDAMRDFVNQKRNLSGPSSSFTEFN